MTTNRDFKRLVRARMTKTGESYTAARLHLLKRTSAPAPVSSAAPPPPPPAPADFARLAGMSDAAIKENTGCNWERWVWALDRVKAHEWPHREIAEYVQEKYKTPDWWTQTVTVGYERIKGLRAIGQRRGGGFEANKSKVFAVPLGRLYRSFSDRRSRHRWLADVDFTVRTASRDKSMRISWPDGTSVEVYFMAKGAAKSSAAISHRRLPDKAAADRMKEFWAERLAALVDVLTPAKRSA